MKRKAILIGNTHNLPGSQCCSPFVLSWVQASALVDKIERSALNVDRH